MLRAIPLKFKPTDYKKLPRQSGVYLFFNKKNSLLYVGKAINLKSRVANYFNGQEKDPRKKNMVTKISWLKIIPTDSEVEALILEAQLIKKFLPPYNIALRDDKQYFYVAISRDPWPIVRLTHQTNRAQERYIGPFTDGVAIKSTLRLLRKAFPYCTIPHRHNKPCPWCHIGLCPFIKENIEQYKKDLSYLIKFLSGSHTALLRSMRRSMIERSRNEDFEGAKILRDQIQTLKNVLSHKPVVAIRSVPSIASLRRIWKRDLRLSFPQRLETYDISNISGLLATGSMVVLANGSLDKKEYRKFHVRFNKKPNDTAMLKEVLSRRLEHKEWPLPAVIMVDGGKGQMSAAHSVLDEYHLTIPVLAFAKGRQELFIDSPAKKISWEKLHPTVRNMLTLADDEAHRFAISYHRLLRQKNLLSEN